MWLVEGLEGGLAALVIKVHHACVDGIRGVQLYDVLFDLTPDAPRATEAGVVPSSEPVPSLAAWFARPRRRSHAHRCVRAERSARSSEPVFAARASLDRESADTSCCRSKRRAASTAG